MSLNVEFLNFPDEIARALYNHEKEPELYRFVYLAALRPDERQIGRIVIAKVSGHVWAVDHEDARRQLLANVPEELPILIVRSIAPVEPNISSATMLEVKPTNDGAGGEGGMVGLKAVH